MRPILFRIPEWVPVAGEEAVTSFGAAVFLALLIAGALFQRRLAARGHGGDAAWELAAAAAVGGLLGAKLYYLALNAGAFLADPLAALAARGGLVWYGGLAGGALAVLWRARRLGLGTPVVAEAAAPALALGYAIGRVGCFLVGDDYGLPTSSRLGVAFPEGMPPTTPENLERYFGVAVPEAMASAEFVAVHPTQLYEAGLSLLVLAGLLWWERRVSKSHGAAPETAAYWKRGGTPPGTGARTSLFALWLLLAGASRFAVELLRAKDDHLPFGLTAAQAISAAAVLAGAALLLRRRPAAAVEAAC